MKKASKNKDQRKTYKPAKTNPQASRAKAPVSSKTTEQRSLQGRVADLQKQLDALRMSLTPPEQGIESSPSLAISKPAPSWTLSPPAASRRSPAAAAHPAPVYELKEVHESVPNKPEQDLFTSLLDRARVQWLMGDWVGLASHDRSSFEHDPQRAIIALLCACGHAQIGNKQLSYSLFALARDWGVNKRLAFKTLFSGSHYCLGRAAYLSGRSSKALLHFGSATSEGFAGFLGPSRQLVTDEGKLRALGLSSSVKPHASTPIAGLARPEETDSKNIFASSSAEHMDERSSAYMARHRIQELSTRIQTEDHPRKNSLEAAANTLQHITGDKSTPHLETTQFDLSSRRFLFTHIHGDYIPTTIKNRAVFYEDAFLEALGCLHSRDGMVIDVGANIGNHTVYFAAVLGADVLAIEPEPHNYFCLSLNAASNAGPGTVRCWNIACGKQESRITLEMKLADNYGSFTSSLTASPQRTGTTSGHVHETPLFRLDNVADPNSAVSILKIDVEGMELDVLEGASDLIARNLPVIAVECSTNSFFLETSAHLRGYGYFPAQVLNATPTFIFLSARNPQHLSGLQRLLAKNAVKTACNNRTFAT